MEQANMIATTRTGVFNDSNDESEGSSFRINIDKYMQEIIPTDQLPETDL